MKAKLFFSTMALAALMAATGCSDEEVVTSSAGNKEWEGTATIKGILYIDADLTTDPAQKEVVKDAKIVVSIDAKSLALATTESAPNPIKTVRTTTDADGNFTVSVPACSKRLEYKITFEDVKTEYKTKKSVTVDGKLETVFKNDMAIFHGFNKPVSVSKGETTFDRYEYSNESMTILEERTNIK